MSIFWTLALVAVVLVILSGVFGFRGAGSIGWTILRVLFWVFIAWLIIMVIFAIMG
ncbi:MAG: DUF1328 domain-containing protein [Candidatus Humimicrobiaceae bacterium]